MEIKIEDGDIFTFPPDLEPIIKDNYVTFKKAPVFKNGDVLVVDSFNKTAVNKTDYILIYNGVKYKDGFGHYIYIDKGGKIIRDSRIFCHSSQLRHATIAEKYAFFQKLKQEKLKWNDKEYKIEQIKWRAKNNEKYYYLNSRMKVVPMSETGSFVDVELYESGNYFRTKEMAKLYQLELKSVLQKFHKEIKE